MSLSHIKENKIISNQWFILIGKYLNCYALVKKSKFDLIIAIINHRILMHGCYYIFTFHKYKRIFVYFYFRIKYVFGLKFQ